jgi:chloride channel protein, CIC family
MIRFYNRFQISESVMLGGASFAVGIATGAGVWLFKQLIDLTHAGGYEYLGTALSHLDRWLLVVIPVFGGLVAGLIIHFFIGEERHHGVAGIMESVALAGGRLRYKRMPAKAVAAALAIGSGASVGPEDPSVQIGANLGSMAGQLLHLSEDHVRTLVAAGAAGGISAAFNAPIAGIFFALEIVLGQIGGNALSMVVLAGVISAVFTQAVSGTQPAFHVPSYPFGSVLELPLYFGLGLISGPVSALYIDLLFAFKDFFEQKVNLPRWVKPVIAGLLVGVVGLFLPQILGVGYETIGVVLNGNHLGIWLLIALMVAKLILTPVCIGSGFPGGVFAPALFIGATLGAAYGAFADALIPSLHIAPPAFALVGMAAVLAGSVHAPLTAIILLFEMTNDYRIILPLMFAVVVSQILSQRLQRDSVYTLSLARKGIRLSRERELEVLELVKVQEIMHNPPAGLYVDDSIEKAAKLLAETRHHGLPVLNSADKLVGVFTVRDLDETPLEKRSELTVGDCCTSTLLVAYPDESVGAVLSRMTVKDVGRLPIVNRKDAQELVGWLHRSDLIKAYGVALTRRAAFRHRADQVRLGATQDGHVNIEEIRIGKGAPCVDKRISDVSWPKDCIIATLRRQSNVFIPHGNTVIKEGDVLVILTEEADNEEILNICRNSASN